METIKSLELLSFDSLFATFNEAFADYEVQVSHKELSVMLSRRGFVPSLSFGLFDNDKMVSFTLNGIGNFNGKNTAYDTGTGTLKEYRGKGFASRVFAYSLPFLKDAGVSQYLLEVLQHNTNAVSVYQKIGFTVSREFNYFVTDSSSVSIPSKVLPSAYRIEEIGVHQKDKLVNFWDFAPSWQNSFEAVMRREADFKVLGAYHEDKIIGYCIFEPISGDVTQIAVDKAYRRKGIASVLLSKILQYNRHSSVKVVNTEVLCSSITDFLNTCKIPLKGKQFEMVKAL